MAHNLRYEYQCKQGHWHKYPWKPKSKLTVTTIGLSSNGRKPDSESVNVGSTPAGPAKLGSQWMTKGGFTPKNIADQIIKTGCSLTQEQEDSMITWRKEITKPDGHYKHIIKEGARYHVISYGLKWSSVYLDTISYRICSEPNCEINFPASVV